MRDRIVLLWYTGTGLLVMGACAPGGSQFGTVEVAAPAAGQVTIQVVNHQRQDVDVFLVASNSRVMLGFVPALSSAAMEIPKEYRVLSGHFVVVGLHSAPLRTRSVSFAPGFAMELVVTSGRANVTPKRGPRRSVS